MDIKTNPEHRSAALNLFRNFGPVVPVLIGVFIEPTYWSIALFVLTLAFLFLHYVQADGPPNRADTAWLVLVSSSMMLLIMITLNMIAVDRLDAVLNKSIKAAPEKSIQIDP